MKRFALASLASVVLIAAVALAADAKKQNQAFGDPIDPKAPRVSLAQLVKNPAPYEGKTIVVEGSYAGACGDGDFFFKDKFDLIEAFPPNDQMMKACKKGDRILLYGTVKVHRSESEEKGSEAKEKSEATVAVLGKGVEILRRSGEKK